MTIGQLNLFIRKLHLWLGIAIGIQLCLWLVSGLFMTLFPIDDVRGTHLRADVAPMPLQIKERVITPAAVLQSVPAAEAVTLRRVGDQLVYVTKTQGEDLVLNAETGDPMALLDEIQANRMALAAYSGAGSIGQSILFETGSPREYGRTGPVWQVNFDKPDKATFYIDARTGDVKAVRTGLWRTFDFMWGLHVMDWSSRENFNSWWIKATAAISVIFFFSGLILITLRLRSALKRRRRTLASK
ncbi:PepSY domain-containing protein [Hyphomonas sp. FCG-A18]|uniref:PepSY domain-containing protein n=1 Tax=Hyphomonas sp. FCG-A18 TaxID=3080019 RepID=UPI002B2D7ABB|nr:PepSY domain-containing protein [Hyphomonas sp. FCG-A18]